MAAASPQDASSPPDNLDIGKRSAVSPGAIHTPATVNGAVSHEASAQAHEQSPASSSEADKEVNSNGSHALSTVAPSDERDSAKAGEKDRDKSSLTATTNTQPNTSSTNTTTSTARRFRKSKAKPPTPAASTSSALDKGPPVRALSKGENKSKSGSQRSPKKESFISKLVRRLVPCVAPNERAHAIEIDHIEGGGNPSRHAEPVVTNEKPQLNNAEQKEKEREATMQPLTQPQLDSSPLTGAQDTEMLPNPPTPPKTVLPPSETAGTTNGTVQPSSPAADIFSPSPASPSDTPHAVPSGARPHAGDVSHSTVSDSDASFTDEGHSEGEEVEGEEGDPMEEDDEDALIMNGGAGIPVGPDGTPRPLLPPIAPQHAGRKCLVLDLDETLVHSSFKSIPHADYVVPVEIEYHWHNVYVIKRPGVDNFLKMMGEIYEVVVFTASLSKYADPVLDKLDIHHVVSHRLFRESCYNHKGNYVKDLSQLGRPISDTIIIDNSPASYIFHPNNAVPVSSWFNDPHDTELTDLCPFLADLGEVPDVRGVLDGGL
ncbi:hypothetical protein ID866_4455 [Astraeus odoratus]|nr:hypothetical protein ID866_4455 [Astraeus odoratus]